MADLAEIYDEKRSEIADLVLGLEEEQLDLPVPATPEWTIRDVVAHLTGDVVCLAAGDFPAEFFAALGSPRGVAVLNAWTERQVSERRGRALKDNLSEWEQTTPGVLAMMRGEDPWPDGVMPFAGHILMTDIATHQQDLFGALGIVRARTAPAIRIGVAAYIGGVGLRIQATGGESLRFVMEDKEVVAGGDEAEVSVSATRYEFFRALSGRRSPEQILAFDWEGNPEPFIPYFYPYGVRGEALVE